MSDVIGCCIAILLLNVTGHSNELFFPVLKIFSQLY